MIPFKKTLLPLVSISAAIGLSSCGDSTPVVVVDLDKVLDTFVSTTEGIPTPIDEKKDKATFMAEFAKSYQDDLNGLPLHPSSQVGVVAKNDGSFLGFIDTNKNGTKDSGEADFFKVEIDSAKNRIIATDMQNSGYHRDHAYSAGTGFLGGYLIGSMLNRQRASGVNTSKFSSMKMSPKGYHSNAVKSVKSARSARSSGGSRSFRSGK